MNAAQLLNPKAFAKSTEKSNLSSSSKLKGKGRGKKSQDGGAAAPKLSVPSYNPVDLLNPRAATKRAQEDPVPKIIQNNEAVQNDPTDDTDGQSAVGMSDMLERRYGVSKREHQPQKRQKTKHDDVEQDEDGLDTKHKDTFNGGGKGGPISEYLNKKREEDEPPPGPPNAVVDLTGLDDEEDDEVTIVKSTGPDPLREVCLGMLDTKVQAHRIPSATNKALDGVRGMWPPSRVYLRRPIGGHALIEVIDKMSNHFGNIEPRTAYILAPMMNASQLHKLRVSAMLQPHKRDSDERPGQPTSKLLGISLTLFASAEYVRGIGMRLSQAQIFLFQPNNPENKEIINPHLPKTYGAGKPLAAASIARQSTAYYSRTVEEVRNDVLGMFDKLTNIESLPEMDADQALLSTELMSHQKQALYFLTKQETPIPPTEDPSNPLWKPKYRKDGSKVYYNVISGDEVKRVDDALGGIFADMMGLGKTLSLLSRICASIEEARAFGDTKAPQDLQNEGKVKRNTKGTLVVCPKSVLSNWDEQIKAHLQRKKITFYSYHGPKREQNIDILAEYDIVITSYTTVATEFSYTSSRFKALGKLNWFRIVLDEAHMIRNQTTSTCLACCDLSSPRRWAVTGTPIQNRLEDLGALIKFIKTRPFHEKGSFERHFIAPFRSGDTQVFDSLRLLVDSMTLRRSKDTIDLPERSEAIHRLDWSDDERALYEAFRKDSGRKVDSMMGANGLKGRGYAHMLTAITRLRHICAHGRELLSDEDMKLLEGMSYGSAIDIDDEGKPGLTDVQVYDMFHLLCESNMNACSQCSADVGKDEEVPEDLGSESEESDDDSDHDLLGYMTPCYHVICPKCIDGYKKGLDKTRSTDNYAYCPVCQQYIRPSCPPITKKGLAAEMARKEEIRKDPRKAKNGGKYGGPHTKVKTLIGKLQMNQRESELIPDEPPVRSVVFSGWTQYLDLIAIALTDAGIGFERLDGKMSVSARTRCLERFRTDPTISVILVSIKAGGQGLNFTAANKVYMMEPQFNPGVELQAIDRVHRLGQTRETEIVRFVMRDSFEESILELQNKKKALASTAFEGGKRMTKHEEVKQRMENLRSLFR